MTAAALSLAALLTVVAALVRAGGAALLRTSRADALHDAAEGQAGAHRVGTILEDGELVAPAVNILHSILLLAAALSGAWGAHQLVTGPSTVGVLVLLGVVLVLVGDLVPRGMARRRPHRLAYRLSPLLALAVGVGSKVAHLVRDEEEGNGGENGEEDEDDADEMELISSVLEFSETIVREVMVPRPDMVVVDGSASIADLLRIIDEHGFSRIPVVGDGVDDVVGLVIVKDLLPRLTSGDPPRSVADVMRPIDFVPETKRVPDLLKEMQASKSHMAVVVDEYGGTAGLVTIEDLLEELVGEIVDEYDEDEMLVEELPDGTWRVDARMPVSDLSEIVGTELPDEEWDTVGGLVLGLAGRVPLEGERFEVGEVELTVTRVQGRRIAEVSVARAEVEAALEDAG